MPALAICSILLGLVSVASAASRPFYYYNVGGPAIYAMDKVWLPSEELPFNYEESKPVKFKSNRLYAASSASVPKHTPLELFNTELYCPRFDVNCTITFDNLDGMYELQLYFAEAFGGNCAVGARVFDVYVNDEVVLPSFDAYAEAGCMSGVMKSFSRDATAGLSITLGKIVEYPALKAVALIPLCSSPSTGELEACPVRATHPSDISIKRDYAGNGDGDSWLRANGEFQTSFPFRRFESPSLVDMSSPDLPAGVPMSLFQSHRITDEDLELQIPLPNEKYVVTLLFAEIRIDGPRRKMNIEMEGEILQENYNIWEENGFNVAAAKKFTVAVEDGTLDIALRAVTLTPYLCGLMIEPYIAGHEESFLHVVIDRPRVVVDPDGAGSAVVDMTGVISHTHEPGETLLPYFEWDISGVLLGTTVNLTTSLQVGNHRIGLTIFDTKTPAESLYGSASITVASPSEVPGMLVKSYLDDGATLPLDGQLGSIEAGYAVHTPLLRSPPGKETGRVYNMYGTLTVTVEPAWYKFVPVGGESAVVLVDGEVANLTEPTLYGLGSYDLEVRFRVTDESQWPLQLLREKGSGAVRAFDFGETTYDLLTEPPLLNSLSPKSGNFKGGQKLFINGLGFTPRGVVQVEWQSPSLSVVLSGNDITISPMADEISFIAPEMLAPAEVTVTVRTTNGQSAQATYFAEQFGAMPIIFEDPKIIFSTSQVAKPHPKDSPTRALWGPDGRLYVGVQIGKIYILTVDEDYNVVEFEELEGVFNQVEHLILGLAFNPVQTGPDTLYVAHGTIHAQGGHCLHGQYSPYPGKVSLLTAPNYDTLTPLITGLPVSNHDHSINGMDFDAEGNLYVSVGGNTNAGIPSCTIGELPESPFSAAILKAEVLKPGFNGEVSYVDRFTGEPSTDQTYGHDAEVVPGVDIRVFAAGFRNLYDLVVMQDGRIFGVDNGPNKPYGLASTGANTTGPDPTHIDEVVYLQDGNYYGHPNRNRGRTDPRQNVYYNLDVPSIPGVFEQTIAPLKSSSNGMDEYRANTFNGALRGQLIVQLLKSSTYNLKLNPDGVTVDKVFNTVLPAMTGLDIAVAPGGALLAASVTGKNVKLSMPIVDKSSSRAHIYDIFPYRAVKGRAAPFVVSGHGFSKLGAIEVFIGGFMVEVSHYTDKRIYGQLPTSSNLSVADVLDVEVVAEDGLRYIYEKGIQFHVGKPLQPAPRTPTWEIGPSMPGKLGEVVTAIVDGILFVMGQGKTFTYAYNFASGEWLPKETYAQRPHPGNHHCLEVYNGKIYVIGGFSMGSLNKVQIFDPVENTWTLGSFVPDALKSGSGSSVLHEGKIYYCGGIQLTFTHNLCGIYDIASNTWSLDMEPMPVGRNHAAHVTDGSKMYVIGGRSGGNVVGFGFNDVQIYDFASKNWTLASFTGEAEPFPLSIGGMGAALYDQGSIYVFGGETKAPDKRASPKFVFNRVEIFDIATGKWRVPGGKPMPWGLHGIWPVKYEGKFYIAGGGLVKQKSESNTFFHIDIANI